MSFENIHGKALNGTCQLLKNVYDAHFYISDISHIYDQSFFRLNRATLKSSMESTIWRAPDGAGAGVDILVIQSERRRPTVVICENRSNESLAKQNEIVMKGMSGAYEKVFIHPFTNSSSAGKSFSRFRLLYSVEAFYDPTGRQKIGVVPCASRDAELKTHYAYIRAEILRVAGIPDKAGLHQSHKTCERIARVLAECTRNENTIAA